MTARAIVLYPDPRLKRRVTPVTALDGVLAAAIADLLDTLAAERAIGLAGPHIGLDLRIVAMRLGGEPSPLLLVNPAVVRAAGEAEHVEGSVSLPGCRETVRRAAAVTVRFQDGDGTVRERDLSGFDAAVAAHEIDQLDGIFFLDRLSRLRRDRLLKKWAKRPGGGPGRAI